MNYVFQFGFVWRELDLLLMGAWLTMKLLRRRDVLRPHRRHRLRAGENLALALCCARLSKRYVEAIRNTPFLVQLLLIYLGFPSIGVRLLPWEAALLAMVVNVGAYATEIVRAGIESVPRQHIEAGRALGLRPWHVFRFIVLFLLCGPCSPRSAASSS